MDRTVEVRLLDSMAYDPETVTVEAGETIRFPLRNVGDIVHEFNIGNAGTWTGHKDEMQRMMKTGMMTVTEVRHDRMQQMGMAHDDPNAALLEPGETAEVIWTFPEDGEVGFACNVPGHFKAGMEGDVVIR